jgi:hypothetical protein
MRIIILMLFLAGPFYAMEPIYVEDRITIEKKEDRTTLTVYKKGGQVVLRLKDIGAGEYRVRVLESGLYYWVEK